MDCVPRRCYNKDAAFRRKEIKTDAQKKGGRIWER